MSDYRHHTQHPLLSLFPLISSFNSTFPFWEHKPLAVILSKVSWVCSCVCKACSWPCTSSPFPPHLPECGDKPGTSVGRWDSAVLPCLGLTKNQCFALLSKRIFANNLLKRQSKNGPVVTHICTQARERRDSSGLSTRGQLQWM